MSGGGLPAVPWRRGIRSFVHRAGRTTRAQRRALEALWPRYGTDASAASNPNAVFTRAAPVMLEIGVGMGDALVAMAAASPERNYLGVEVYPPGLGSALLKIDAEGLENARLVRADAVDFLDLLLNSSLDGVLVFFPDPWPKKRHHKRRLVQAPFVNAVYGKLKEGGKFELATDWEPYALKMLSIIEAHGGFNNTAGAGNFAPRSGERPVTKFQRRGEKLGHAIFDLVFERRSPTP